MNILIAILFVLLGACHGRSYVGPEDILLNAAQENSAPPAIVEATIGGVIQCASCAAGSTMLIELRDQAAATGPIQVTPYDRVGDYQVTVRVPALTALIVTARVFVPGGTRLAEQAVEVPEGEEAVSLSVNLALP
ncbi:MAG: hypothetical protein HYV03_01495 [Deltaproteobacteria bacterium]|nr:hypothetical protein [Deltaproteobacteria bacterium]